MNHPQSELESEDVTSYQIRSDYKCIIEVNSFVFSVICQSLI